MPISYDEFKKVEIRAGKILSAEKVPDTDKLLKLMVDFGEKMEVVPEKIEAKSENIEMPDASNREIPAESNSTSMVKSPINSNEQILTSAKQFKFAPRQIVSGIALRYPDPAVLVGKTCMFVTNLESRTIKGLESNGMLFAVSTPEGGFSLLEPNETIPAGTIAA